MSLLLTHKEFILVSQSLRRKHLLQKIGISFSVQKSSLEDEASILNQNLNNEDNLNQYNQKLKTNLFSLCLEKIKQANIKTDKILIAADTIVQIGNKILGKPKNYLEAQKMLFMLSSQKHLVKTAIVMLDQKTTKTIKRLSTTEVYFDELKKEAIHYLLSDNEYLDKAGSYAIQGKASIFIKKIKGCYYNVVGLPLNVFYQMLNKF